MSSRSSIQRSTDLDIDVAQLWELISTSEGWSSWLVDEASVHVAPAATGVAIDDGVVREIRIESVATGRGLGFSWWDRDDPSSVSHVQLDIIELPHGRSQLHITDRGLINTGLAADLVIFDPATVADRATFTDPFQYPVGIPTVIVNGRVVLDNGRHTGERPGIVIRGRGVSGAH